MLKKIKKVLKRKNKISKRALDEKNINLEKLEKMMLNEDTILIDVRSLQEYKEGHLEKAISIPEYELKNRAKEELKDLNQKIILYCSTGSRSKKAKETLEKLGYKDIYNLENGWQNYWAFKVYMLKLSY